MKFKDHPNQSSGSNTFLTIKDQQSVKGIFIGDIYEFYTKWVGGKSVVTDESDSEAKIRFRCNFITAGEDGDLTTKIWEFPYAVYESLKAINEEYPLETTKVKISRMGTGTSTNYSIMPLVGPKDVLTKVMIEALKKMPVHDLEKKKQTPVVASGVIPESEIEF